MNSGRPLPSIPTWKLKHSKAALRDLALDEGMFDRGYRMRAVSPGELKFPSWEKCRQSGVTADFLRQAQPPCYVGVDLASAKRPGNAFVALGLQPGTLRRNLLDVRFGAWSSPDTAAALADFCLGKNVQFIQVENNAYQQSIIDWVKKEKPDFPYWMKIEAFTTGTAKANPDYGLPALEVEFKNGGWVAPWAEWEVHQTTCRCDWCRLDREFRLYPKGSSTDGVMAAWFARDALNKWGHLVLGGSQTRRRSLNTR